MQKQKYFVSIKRLLLRGMGTSREHVFWCVRPITSSRGLRETGELLRDVGGERSATDRSSYEGSEEN